MLKNKIFRRLAFIISLIVLLTSTINTTFGFIVTKTDSLVNVFIPAVSEQDGIKVNIIVNKTVKNTGVSSIGPAGFEFVLENTENGEKQALKSDENGDAVFSLVFTAEDAGKAFTYKLSETNDGMTGVTYDTKVYDISVFISFNENNKIIATITKDGEAVDEVIAKFENTYYTERPTSPPTGDNSNITFWFIMMVISGSVCIFLAITDKKYCEREKISKS